MPPIQVSAANVDVRKARGSEITFSTKYPFAKLDSTRTPSFQLINILFVNEPPNPDGTISKHNRTLLYQFAHGYKYIPSTWFMVSKDDFASAVGQEGALIFGTGGFVGISSAHITFDVDEENVYVYCDKFYGGAPFTTPVVIGIDITIRAYVFANDLSGNDVPKQA